MNKFTIEKLNKIILQNESRALIFYFNENKDVALTAMRSKITVKEMYDFYLNETNSNISFITFKKLYYKYRKDNKDYIIHLPKDIITTNDIKKELDQENLAAKISEPTHEKSKETITQKTIEINNSNIVNNIELTEDCILKDKVKFYSLSLEERESIKKQLDDYKINNPNYEYNRFERKFLKEYKMYANMGKVSSIEENIPKFKWEAT